MVAVTIQTENFLICRPVFVRINGIRWVNIVILYTALYRINLQEPPNSWYVYSSSHLYWDECEDGFG